MRSLFGLLIIPALLSIILSMSVHRRRGHSGYDWFWDKNFSDGSKHDKDLEREFWRDPGSRQTVTLPDEDPTEPVDNPMTGEDNPTDPVDDPTTAEEDPTDPVDNPTTEEIDYTGASNPIHGGDEYSTTDPTTDNWRDTYYEKKKKQALACEGDQQSKTELDDNTCQICTCNGEGGIFCSKIPCDMDDSGMKLGHKMMLKKAMDSNQVLREFATGCKPGDKVDVREHCVCTCVLEGVMSCPKRCFISGPNGEYTAGTDETTTDNVTGDTTEYEGING